MLSISVNAENITIENLYRNCRKDAQSHFCREIKVSEFLLPESAPTNRIAEKVAYKLDHTFLFAGYEIRFQAVKNRIKVMIKEL